MPVTVMYNGSALTFPEFDNPDDAYKQLGASNPSAAPSTGDNFFGPSTATTASTDVSKLDAKTAPKDIDPALLKQNKDWLTASRVLYKSTQGKDWDEAQGNDKLADFGLESMAAFNYNLPIMGITAVGLKNAPPEQKKAFMYLLDTFDKTNYSAAGAGRFAKYAALDPTTYVGLSTLGVGSAAAEGVKLTTMAGVKAALKVGAVGALEGATFGGAQSRIDQEARVNADGQATVDYGHVALGAGIGAGAGMVLAPLISAGANAVRGARPHELPHADLTPEPTAPHVEGEQMGLPLGDMSNPQAASQARMDRLGEDGKLGVPPTATEQTLPGFAPREIEGQPAVGGAVPFEQLPLQRNIQSIPPEVGRLPPTQSVGEQADRLMSAWDVSHQHEMFPRHGEDPRMPPSVEDGTIKLKSSTAQGELFDHLPPNTQTAIDEALTKSASARVNETRGLNPTEASTKGERAFAPKPDEKIGAANGPSLLDLKRLLSDIGSSIEKNAIRGWSAMADVTSPLRRALAHLTPADAKEIARKFASSAMTEHEYRGFSDAVIGAQNLVASTIKAHLRVGDTAKALEAEKILMPLKTLAKEAGSFHGSGLSEQRQNLYKGAMREVDTDTILRGNGIDPHLATDAQRADALSKWVTGIVDNAEKVEKDTRVLDLRQRIAETTDVKDTLALYDKMAELRRTIADEQSVNLSYSDRARNSFRKVASDIGSYLAMTVLTPASTVVNLTSNALRVFSRPVLDYLGRGPLDKIAFRQMTASYSAMRSVSVQSLQAARLAFETETSLLAGTESKWIENQLNKGGEASQNNVVRFMGRNGVRIWMRLLNSGDEFFQQLAYHGYVQGDAVGKAMLAARERGLNAADTAKLVDDHVEHSLKAAYNTNPDATVIGMLREAGMKQGLSGDNLKLYVQNTLDKDSKLLRRATNEEGINYTNDLLFKQEFSGEGSLSSMAKGYESFISNHPEMRIIGQLFFRTPVRVFEAGMRLTPLVQFAPGTKFMSDLTGNNGMARQLRARGELVASYGITASVITAYATGSLTGDGYNLDVKQRRIMEDAGWRPYSIKVGDKYISYRNYDPLSTPIKIIVNAMERLQKVDFQKAQGVYEAKGPASEVFGYVAIATGSILQAVRDANLTSGVDDLLKFGEALADPEKKEHAFLQLFQSKAQLAVPNAVRRGVKSFGDGQNVANEPATYDQVLSSIVNPSTDQVTHQYDALGNKRAPTSQGFFPYIGIDAAGKDARSRGLSDKDQYSLGEIAKMSFATGKTFTPPSKSPLFPDHDLKEEVSADGRTTLYNKAMQEFNKNMPPVAHDFLKSTEAVASGRKGMVAPRAAQFELLHNNMWKAAVQTTLASDQRATDARIKQQSNKADVFSGKREIASPFKF